ncbi:MFS transporter [Streptomyces tubbatahanensis]|uniref:MFS transporter n=1 Tax=Streptomyces tubbatahanensis TaxID=2923272 RepID=A0ABY3XZ23_9ACTN|nr:MFS transporter [Streptomyces tubbatahanensis]UNS99508.1 MFS transporter [Streptomyces tubbatahanensis]
MKAYLATAFLARLADEGVAVALALLALERTGSPALGAYVLTAWLAPHAVAAPVAGALAERARRPRLFHGGALAVFGTAIAVLGLTVGRAPAWLPVTAAVLGGCAGPVVTGSLSSLLGSLVPEGRARSRAYALDAASYNAAAVTAPAAVSTTVAVSSAGPGAALLAVSAGCATLLAATTLPHPARLAAVDAGPARSAGALRDRLTAGVRVLWSVPQLRALTVATCVAFLGIGGLPVAAVLLAGDAGTAGAAGNAAASGRADGGGVLMTAFAVGGLVGSLGLARWRGAPEAGRLALGSLCATALALAGAALAPAFPLTVALFALAGLGDGPLLTATLRLRAEHAPAGARTQVFTLGAGLKLTSAAAGSALVGLLAQLPPAALVLGVAASQLAAAAVLRALDRPPPRVEGRSRHRSS